jgi:hypothetical protein
MILLDPVAQILALADADHLPVGLAAVNDNVVRSAVTLRSPAQEALRDRKVTVLTEPGIGYVTDPEPVRPVGTMSFARFGKIGSP